MKTVLRLVALVFVAAGALLITIDRADPAGRVPRVIHAAPLATVEFGAADKLGRYVALALVGVDERYHVTLLQKVDGLEARLRARLAPGVEVALTSVERVDGSWSTPAGVPLPILELRCGDEALVDSTTFETPLGRAVARAVPIAGALGVLAGVALFALSRRVG